MNKWPFNTSSIADLLYVKNAATKNTISIAMRLFEPGQARHVDEGQAETPIT